MEIKQYLYQQCFIFIEQRLITVQKTMSEIQESLTSETKSSAGDKHETGRAMLQLEREKAGNQLSEIVKVKDALSKIDTSKTHKIIGLGSVVYTTQANYYISISSGVLKFKETSFYGISPSTPIGQLLIGKTVGDIICFRAGEFSITAIL